MPGPRTAASHTQAYREVYDLLRRVCMQADNASDDVRLCAVETAVRFASAHHPGLFADGAVENVALEIGRTLERYAFNSSSPAARHPATARRRVLHVSPVVAGWGGHTRTLTNWVTADTESQHSLVLFDQGTTTVPGRLAAGIAESGGTLVSIPVRLPLVARAAALRSLARDTADVIVLHHCCNHAVPVAALADPSLPPVAFVDDCDQAFWIGSTVADVVVHQREAGARLARERRFVRDAAVLPIPLADPAFSREEARRALGLPDSLLAIVSVGRGTKYRPKASHNFLRTAQRLLDRAPMAHLYVVGLSEAEADAWGLEWRHPRVHLCGRLNERDTNRYQAAADLYLESFPFGSATALLETALASVPVVLPFAPEIDLLVTNHGLEPIVGNPRDEDEYLATASSLLASPRRRREFGAALAADVRRRHTGADWRQRLEDVYRQVARTPHLPRRIASPAWSDSKVDRVLSEWHDSQNRGRQQGSPRRQAVEALAVTAYRARQQGERRTAAGLLLQSLRTIGGSSLTIRELLKVPVQAACSGVAARFSRSEQPVLRTEGAYSKPAASD